MVTWMFWIRFVPKKLSLTMSAFHIVVHTSLISTENYSTVRDVHVTKQNHVGVENPDSMIFMAPTNRFCCRKVVCVLRNFLCFSKLNFILGISVLF